MIGYTRAQHKGRMATIIAAGVHRLANWASRITIKTYLFFSRFRRGMTLGVRGAVFDAQGRIFLVRHGYVPGWYMPGGGVDAGETLGEALERELMEEGGVRLDGPAPLFGIYLNRSVSRRDHVALFVCRFWTRVSEPAANYEIAESGFFPLDDLPEETTPGTRRRISEIVDGRSPATEW
jgi:8-oxo-dGTP pyrophosphatase MutT (NUDIX family)